MLKPILNFVVFLFLTNINLQAQDPTKPTSWQSYFKDDKIEVSYKYGDCHLPSEGLHHENIYFKVVNLTNQNLLVRWEREIYYNEKCANCDSKEGLMQNLSLKPLEIKEGSCTENCPKELALFVKMLDLPNKSEVSSFKLAKVASYNIDKY